MANHLFRLPALLLLLTMIASTTELEEREAHVEPVDAGGYRTYIVLLERPGGEDDMDDDALRAWHQSYLPSMTTALGQPRLKYSYRTVFTGFAARLTEEELKQVSAKPGFVRSFPNVICYLQTTRTPAFLGLPNRMGESPDNWPGAGGSGMIIGVVDSGIDGYHPSLNDDGFEDIDPPERWKGSCQQDQDIRCNRKLIGAQNMYEPGDAPVDDNGHGTHVATTAAGNFVSGASVNGVASGNASGVAPYAHLAIYKACGEDSDCPHDALLIAIDKAVKDGVDVLSLSISTTGPATFDHDPIAVGTFTAMQQGVQVIACAGNYGPEAYTVKNIAPWILTVGAGTVDRSFTATVHLDGTDQGHAVGESLADRKRLGPQQSNDLLYRFGEHREFCAYPFEEMVHLIRDKIMICDHEFRINLTTKIINLLMLYNAKGVLLIRPEKVGYTIPLDDFGPENPVIQVPYGQGQILKDFASWSLAKATINFGAGTEVPFSPAPTVAYFSGRGPSKVSPGILKPDVLAPGVNILAGIPTSEPSKSDFAFMSGTSMATPHVSGLAALLKRTHPTWSAAIIRSALMTTADFLDNGGRLILDEHRQQAGFYATGGGQVNLTRAMDPGLAYDLNEAEYTGYLCTNLGEEAMRAVSRNATTKCSDFQSLTEAQLNYPSVVVDVQLHREAKFVNVNAVRTLTNLVAEGLPEVYTVAVDMPGLVFVDVDPGVLNFTSPGQKQSYTIRVTARPKFTLILGSVFEGSITWSSSRGHIVRSPLLAVVGLGTPQPSTAWRLD